MIASFQPKSRNNSSPYISSTHLLKSSPPNSCFLSFAPPQFTTMLALRPFQIFCSNFHNPRCSHVSPKPPLHRYPSSGLSKMPSLLDLDDDILEVIFEKLLNPVHVFQHKRISASAISIALPLASTCTRLMSIFSCSLVDLELWTSAKLTDGGLTFICTRGKSHVKRLVLRGCNRLLTSFHSISLCNSLRTLDLSFVLSVTDVVLRQICRSVGRSLRSLLLRRCIRLTDDGIRAVAEHCIELRALDIGGLLQITDGIVEHVAKLQKPTLQILVLSWCQRLTDASLHALADTNLQAVFLRGLRITDSGVEVMVKGIGERLVALDLLNCPDVSNSVFTGCLQQCPNLKAYLAKAEQRRIFENCVALLAGYVHVVGGVNQDGQESTVVCVVDAGSANSFSFHVLSGEAMTFDTADIMVIATNSGVVATNETREFLMQSFGIEV